VMGPWPSSTRRIGRPSTSTSSFVWSRPI
jgi:hypothetical protein